MKELKTFPDEEDLIAFLVDPDSFSAKQQKQLAAKFHKDISKWEALTGTTPSLSRSRYHKIRAAFWERTETTGSLARTFCYTVSGIVAVVMFYFVLAADITPKSDVTTISVPVPVTEEYSAAESFENFTDSLMPVDPLPDTDWFSIRSDSKKEENILEDLLTLTIPEGELS